VQPQPKVRLPLSEWLDWPLGGFVIKNRLPNLVLAESKSHVPSCPTVPDVSSWSADAVAPVSWACVLRSTWLISGQHSSETNKGNCPTWPLVSTTWQE
jgi:hypothetical protein